MGARQVSLPMYGGSELLPIIERWWGGLARYMRDRGVADVPDALTWPADVYDHWCSPDLLFSQTCGHPLVNLIAQDVQLVATPTYEAPGCARANYASHVLVQAESGIRRLEELRESRLAVNGPDSYSGYHVWPHLLPPGDSIDVFFGAVITTGSHRASVQSVQRGEADACAVDCVTHALLGDAVPADLEGTRILTTSPPAPAPPFVTSATTSDEDVACLRDGLFAAFADPDLADARAALRLNGVDVPTDSVYLAAFERS